MKRIILLQFVILFTLFGCKSETGSTTADKSKSMKHKHPTLFKTIEIDGITIAYREAGSPDNPTIVLLHGFPSSSHQYRKVLSELSDNFHLIAPDYPGFGNSDFPSASEYSYTFDNIAKTIDAFLIKKKISRYAR